MALWPKMGRLKEVSQELRGPVGKVSVAAAIPRVVILLGTIIAGRLLPETSFDRLIYAISASSTLQILLDPCVYVYLPLVAPNVSRRHWARLWVDGLLLQVLAGTLLAGLMFALAVITHASEGATLASISVGVLAGLEGIARYARVEHQVRGKFGKFAMTDVVISVGRLVSFLVLEVHPSLDAFALGCAVACVFPIISIARVYFDLPWRYMPVPSSTLRLLGKVWQYGLSTTFSGLQAQAPAVLLGITGTIRSAAIYGYVSRLTQPTELIPYAIAAVMLPALVSSDAGARRGLFRHSLWQARIIGVLVGLAVVGLGYGVLKVSHQYSHEALLTLIILSVVLPVKFGNYQNGNATIVLGGVRFRLILNACLAGVAVALVLALAPDGPVVVALVILAVEVVAAFSYALHLRHRNWHSSGDVDPGLKPAGSLGAQ
jgi:O-antigen/teichoic acid export membrane protein